MCQRRSCDNASDRLNVVIALLNLIDNNFSLPISQVCRYAHQKFRSFVTILRRTSSYCASNDDDEASYKVNRKFSTGFSYKWVWVSLLFFNIFHWSIDRLSRFRLQNNDKSAIKCLWPVHCREFLFLPVFPVLNHELDQNYDIVQFIAKGSFGSVYQVRRRKDLQVYALKVSEKSKVRFFKILYFILTSTFETFPMNFIRFSSMTVSTSWKAKFQSIRPLVIILLS